MPADAESDAGGEDERQVEMDSITAIFPEIVLDPTNKFAASLYVPVLPSSPVPITVPTSSDGAEVALETQSLSHLPSLHLQIVLPEGYPSVAAPIFRLSTFPPWLPQETLSQLEESGLRLWEEFGHDQVVYAYVDRLQQAAENAFGVLDGSPYLDVSSEHKISLLDYDTKAKKAAFDKDTFDCGICLDPKKGAVCHRMTDCGHVFCRQCLQDFYNNAITEGDTSSVKCLEPNCARVREAAVPESEKRRKPKTQLSPGELLQIAIPRGMVERYVDMKHKKEVESDSNTIYCPRTWCSGVARSKKHKKPSHDFDKMESSDEESEDEAEPLDVSGSTFDYRNERLSICEDCEFAFCGRCWRGWHGVDNTYCVPRRNTEELTEEEKASLAYLEMYSSPCPTCNAPVQKTSGCNHIKCSRCETHFCYLCSAWIPKEEPYRHFNMPPSPCIGRLWEKEAGDGEPAVPEPLIRRVQPANNGVVGVNRLVDNDDDVLDEAMVFWNDDEPDFQEQRIGLMDFIREPMPAPRHLRRLPLPLPEPIEVAREGPLILRLAVPPPPPPHVPDPPQPAIAVHRARGGANNVHGPRLGVPQQRQPVPVRRAPRGRVVGGIRPNIPIAQPARAIGGNNRVRGGGNGARQHRQVGDDAAAPLPPAQQGIDRHRAWIQNFLAAAHRDEEDLLDSDDDDDDADAAFDIPWR